MAKIKTGARGQFQKEKKQTKEELRDIGKELKEQLVTYDKIDGMVNKIFKVEEMMLAAAKSSLKIDKNTTAEMLAQRKLDAQALNAAKDMVAGVKQKLQFFRNLQVQARAFTMILAANPILALVAAAVVLYQTLTGIAKKIAETRKELGVSAVEAVKINVAMFGLGKAAALSGLTVDEDLMPAFAAARETLGASRDEALGLSLSLAKTAMRSGQTADQLTRTLTLMESISASSREALLSQIEMTGQMIQQAGLAPGDIFKDVADNAEHFASFARDGGDNIIKAAMAAKRLGLNMSAVSGIAESLLDFETSIEKSMDASMLLGREINTDRARMLAATGKHEDMMKEVQRLAGSEAEFNNMSFMARRALAESLGTNVEQLARIVKGQQTDASAFAVGNAMGDTGQQQVYHLNNISQKLDQGNKNTKVVADEARQ